MRNVVRKLTWGFLAIWAVLILSGIFPFPLGPNGAQPHLMGGQLVALSDGTVIIDSHPGGLVVYGPQGTVMDRWKHPKPVMRGHRLAVSEADELFLRGSDGTVYLRHADDTWTVVGHGPAGTQDNFRLLDDNQVEAGRPNSMAPSGPVAVGEWMFREASSFTGDDGSVLQMGWFHIERRDASGVLLQTYAPPLWLRWIRWFLAPPIGLICLGLMLWERRLKVRKAAIKGS